MDRAFIKCLLYIIKVESKDMSLKEYVSLSLCLKNMLESLCLKNMLLSLSRSFVTMS